MSGLMNAGLANTVYPPLPKKLLGKKTPRRSLSVSAFGDFANVSQLPIPKTTPVAGGWGYNIGDTKWDMLGNDVRGCCVVAAAYHAIMSWTSSTGNPLTTNRDIVLKLYDDMTGGVDSGLVMLDFIKYWKTTGLPCLDSRGNSAIHKILGATTLDVSSVEQLDAATYLFEGILYGIQCPQSAVDDTSNWTVVSGSPNAGGHAIYRVRYGRAGGKIVSWGEIIPHTRDFMHQYLDEAFAVVSEDQLNLKGVTPIGFSKEDLLSAMANPII